MKVKNFQQSEDEKKNEGVVISQDPKIIYKGVNQYGMYYYEHIRKDNPKPVGFLVLPEYIPITEIVQRDAKERESDLVQSFSRRQTRRKYETKVNSKMILKASEAVKKPIEPGGSSKTSI